MSPSLAVCFLALVGFSAALPVEQEDGLVYGVPVLIQEPTGLRSRQESPLTYALFLSKLDQPEDPADYSLVEKRSVKDDEGEDLETAAGTYALRPLFVYRQQLAYRQRVRDAIRRGNRF